MKEDNFATQVEKKVDKNFPKIKKAPCYDENYYDHPSFYVNDLSEYIKLVTSIASVNNDYLPGDTVIFRGISDLSYELTPGLARLKKIKYDTEKTMINDFLTRRPDAFNGLSDFDVLAKMQHYGLPTRLLDFSTNPLVALYFACQHKSSKDGRVLCHNTYLKNDTDVFINAVCSTAVKRMFDENYTIDEYFCSDDLSLHKYLSESYLCEETTVVRPKYWNQRIANQAGVFMVFTNNSVDRYRGVLIKSENLGVSKSITEYGFGQFDENIIKEIFEKENIQFYKENDCDYLFKDYLNQIMNSYKKEKIEENYWEENKKYFENRFRVDLTLKLLSSQTIKNSFCSIIVEANKKKRILRELSYVGIGADYIYPELEYTAKEIKSRFE